LTRNLSAATEDETEVQMSIDHYSTLETIGTALLALEAGIDSTHQALVAIEEAAATAPEYKAVLVLAQQVALSLPGDNVRRNFQEALAEAVRPKGPAITIVNPVLERKSVVEFASRTADEIVLRVAGGVLVSYRASDGMQSVFTGTQMPGWMIPSSELARARAITWTPDAGSAR
jgi:hypothetical protein